MTVSIVLARPAEVGDSDEDTYPESHTTRSTGHTAALARLQSDAASPRRASPTASPMSLDAVTPARVPSYAAQAQRNTLPRAHSRELQQLQVRVWAGAGLLHPGCRRARVRGSGGRLGAAARGVM